MERTFSPCYQLVLVKALFTKALSLVKKSSVDIHRQQLIVVIPLRSIVQEQLQAMSLTLKPLS